MLPPSGKGLICSLRSPIESCNLRMYCSLDRLSLNKCIFLLSDLARVRTFSPVHSQRVVLVRNKTLIFFKVLIGGLMYLNMVVVTYRTCFKICSSFSTGGTRCLSSVTHSPQSPCVHCTECSPQKR